MSKEEYYKPAAAQEAVAIEVPAGAIYNGFAYADRIETYGFECEGGPLTNCTDYVEFRRCFSHLADWASTLPPFYTSPVAAALVAQSPTKPVGSDACPVTGLPFYDNMDHPERGMIAMYGGPFDVYSIPELQDNDDELRRERYDLDADNWVEGGEPLGYFYSEQQPEAASTPAAPGTDLTPFRPFIVEARNNVYAYIETMRKAGRDCSAAMEKAKATEYLLDLIDATTTKGGSMSDCPIIRLAPGEYTDWEKRVWRRGVIECATQSDIAAAMQATSAEVKS